MSNEFNVEYVVKVLEFFQHREAGGITEVRIFPKDRYLSINGRREYVGKTVSGYYDDYAKLAQDIQPFDGRASIYVTINPVKPALLARYNNRLEYNATHTTSDDDILIDLWFPYDVDPQRPADISSTDAELKAALAKRDEVAEFLSPWAVSINGMSGNGGHGLIRLVGYPNTKETRQAKEKLTHYLKDKFSDAVVSIDNTVFNMARIWKLYGVMSTKGDNVHDRPHRRAYLEIPETIPEPVDLYAKLDEIIPPDWTPKDAKATIQPKRKLTTPTNGDYPLLDVEAYLQHYGVEYKVKEKADRTIYELFPCPFNPEHNHGEAHIAQCLDGKMEAACKHNSCAGKGWQEFKAAIGDPKTFYEKTQGYGTQKQSSQTPEVTPPKTKDNKFRDDKRTHHLLFLAKRWHHQGNRRKEILAMLTAENESKCEPVLKEEEIQSILDKVLPPLKTITAAELLAMDIPEPKWAIPDFVPEGLTILAGRPKVGKSWMALSFSAAVAMGGYAFGKVQCEQGAALFVGLEDNNRRLQNRLEQICDYERPEKLHLLLSLPRLDRGGLDVLGDWLDDHPDVRLVVIDTLQKVKPQTRRKSSDLYSEDYDFVGTLQQFALGRGIALIVVHHTRKAEADYMLDELSGTTGISAGADCILMLKRKLDGHILYRTGRDVEEGEFAVRRDNTVGGWELLGDAKEFAISEQRRAIIEVIREAREPVSPKEIAEALQKNHSTTRALLRKMVIDGDVKKVGGKYTTKKEYENSVNSVNSINSINSINSVNSNSTVYAFTPEQKSVNSVETSQDLTSSDPVYGVYGVYGDYTEQQFSNSEKVDDDISSCSPEQNGKLSKQLNEYLADCSDRWIDLIHSGLKANKFPLSIAVEASRRMSNGDSQGAWRLIQANGG